MRALRMFAVAGVAAGLSCSGCEPKPQPPARDTVAQGAPPQPTPAGTPAADSLGWEESAGSVLLVADSAAQSAEVVFPELDDSALASTTRFDAARVRNVQLDLFGRGGKVGEAAIPATAELKAGGEQASGAAAAGGDDPDDSADGGGCTVWPTVTVPAPGATPGGRGPAWTVAFLRGRAEAVALDSIAGMRRPDSARFAAEVTRLASAIPNDTAQAFFGLPFEVKSAYRFRAAPGVDAVVATVVRKIGQEANPREQHTLFIAERDSGRTTGAYRMAYVERVSGSEDVVETREVLAAVTLGARRAATLVIGRHFYEGWSYAILERVAPLKWRVRWNSAYAGC